MNRPGVVEGCQDIVQSSLCMRPLEYHAFVSALRIHDTAGESYLTNKRNQVENSSFVSYTTSSYPASPLIYQPCGGEHVTVTPADRSTTPYNVSIPARAVITSIDNLLIVLYTKFILHLITHNYIAYRYYKALHLFTPNFYFEAGLRL